MCLQTDSQTDIARASLISMLIMPIYTLLGLSRFLLYVTLKGTNAVYTGRQGRPSMKAIKTIFSKKKSPLKIEIKDRTKIYDNKFGLKQFLF